MVPFFRQQAGTHKSTVRRQGSIPDGLSPRGSLKHPEVNKCSASSVRTQAHTEAIHSNLSRAGQNETMGAEARHRAPRQEGLTVRLYEAPRGECMYHFTNPNSDTSGSDYVPQSVFSFARGCHIMSLFSVRFLPQRERFAIPERLHGL